MKRKLLFLAAFVASALGMRAQSWTDVTNTYITNASLVSDYFSSSNNTWWPVYTTGRTGNTQHPKNWYLHTNGTTNHNINTGDGFFECWKASQGVKRWTLFQDITLPAGKYRLTGQYSTNESRGIIKTVAITPHHSYYSPGITSSNWGSWGSETAEFTIYEETKVRVGMISNNFAKCHGFTLTTTGAKQLLADVIAAAPAGVSTTTAQNVYDDGGSDDAAYRSAAKTLHDAIVAYNIENATASSPVDMTNYITDPSFEGIANATAYTGGTHGVMEAWSHPSVTDGGVRSLTGDSYLVTDNSEDGFYAVNLWNSSATTYYVQQTISGLPVGRYVLTATYASDANNTASLSIGTGSNTITATGKGTFVQGSSTYDLNSSEDVVIRLESNKWYKVDNFRLSYLGDPLKASKAELTAKKAEAVSLLANAIYNNVVGNERSELSAQSTATAAEETVAAYEETIAAVQDAIDKFIVAKTNYDALVVEIDKAKALGIAAATADTYAATASSTAATALTSTQNLKVAEYNYVTTNYAHSVSLGEWTSTGINTSAATFSNEHWSGTTHEYKNQNDNNGQGWNASSWSINFSQNVTLPAGNYVFKVAGRQASGDAVNTSLVVTKTSDSSVLGTVSDFPRSNNSRGINKSGATAFEGENDVFANSGNGYGWEWRYVKFTLASDETVNIAINSVATASHQWVSFGDYTLETDNEANISLIAYNIALNDAITARDNATYNNIVVGTTERDELIAAITADGTLDKSNKTAIDAAKDVLVAKTTAFTGAKSAYDTWAATKVIDYEDNLPYASSTKFAAIATAQGATPTTAAAATTATTAVLSAYRLYVESNAMAEGLAGAEDKTSLIANPNFADVTISGTTAGGWTFDQTGGTVMIRPSSEQPLTDGTGSSDYSYFDYNNNSNNNQNIHQIINLEPGRYLLTAAGRGATNFSGNLQLYAVGKGDVKIPAIGNDNGAFGRGWNDATLEFGVSETADITIGVKTNNSKSGWWSATRFRLVKLPIPDVAISEEAIVAPSPAVIANVTLTRTLKGGQWNGFSVPFGFTVAGSALDGAEVKEFDEVNDNEIKLKTATVIVAGEPYLVKPADDVVNPTFNGVVVSNPAEAVHGDGSYKFAAHLYNTALATDGSVAYVSTTDSSIKKLTSGSIKGLRAIFNIPTGSEAKALVVDFGEGTTGILNVDAEGNIYEGQIYNLAGQRVNMTQKGLYIVNGKKVLIK